MLERLAHLIVRRRRVVIGIWIVLTLFGAYLGRSGVEALVPELLDSRVLGLRGEPAHAAEFGSGEQPPLVAVFHTTGDITKQTGIAKAIAAAAAVNPDSRVSSYWSTGSRAYISKDGHTAFAEIYPPGNPNFTSSTHSPRPGRR